MNKDAEAEIERLAQYTCGSRGGDQEILRAAMEWAYRDAARICRESNSLNKFACAYAIQKQSGIAGERDSE